MAENATPFNLADVQQTLTRRWKAVALFVIIVAVLTVLCLFFILPAYYRSAAIVVAANPALADKARIFNDNIEGLYSTFGSSDDLDRLYGIANLDTTYKMLVDEFNLVKYYKLRAGNALDRRKAILKLRDDLQLQKTETYQLKIMVWHKDKQVAASMANRMVEIVKNMAEELLQQTNKSALNNLRELKKKVETQVRQYADSTQPIPTSGNYALWQNRQISMLDQLKQFDKAINEYELAITNKQPALFVLESAYASAKADKPKKAEVLIGAVLAALLFGIISVLVYDRNHSR